MKTVPNEIIYGFENNLERCLLIKLSGKNEDLRLSTKPVILMNGDVEIPVICDWLPVIIDEKVISPLSKIIHEIDPSKGGGCFSGNRFSINLLNFDEFENVISGLELDGREAQVFLFFKTPGSDLVEISNTLLLAGGKIEEIIINDYRGITIKCVTYELIDHKVLPDRKITGYSYPYAPDSSLEKSIQAIYGSFMDSDLSINTYNVIPGLCIDENEQEYILAHHECSSNEINCYYPAPNLSFLSKIISDYTIINSSEKFSVKFSGKIKCEAAIQPKIKGSQLNTEYNLSFKNAVDKNGSSLVSVLSNHNFYLRFRELGIPGHPDPYNNDINTGYFRLYFKLGNVINGLNGIAAKIKYYLDGSFTYLNGYNIDASMSNTEASFLFSFNLNDLFKILSRIELGMTIEQNGSVEIKNMFIRFKYYPY